MANKVHLIGRLGKNPELRYASNNNPVVTFSMATSEKWKDKQGAKQEKTTWHNIVIWGKLAEICNQYVRKGSLLAIYGKIDNRSYDDKDGNKRYISEVIADEMEMLDGKRDPSDEASDFGGNPNDKPPQAHQNQPAKTTPSGNGRTGIPEVDQHLNKPKEEKKLSFTDDELPF